LSAGGPSLFEIYGQELVDQLSQNVVTPSRWGFDQGQGALVTTIYEKLVLSPLIQEMLSGYFTSSQTIIEIYRAVTDLLPGYAYPLDSEPTPAP
jgi:hypothetical protein